MSPGTSSVEQHSDNAPAGIIFHVARCGSTLISQSLKQLGNLAVYASRSPSTRYWCRLHEWPRADMVAAIRALGSAFARHAGGPYVLKLSSWNTLFCDIVTAAFPETNWVLCLRDPVEVGVSLLQQPPGWLSSAGEASPRGLAEMIAPDAVPGFTRGARGGRIRCVLRRRGAPRRRTGQARCLRGATRGGVGRGGLASLSCGRRPEASRTSRRRRGRTRRRRSEAPRNSCRMRRPSRPPPRPSFAGRSSARPPAARAPGQASRRLNVGVLSRTRGPHARILPAVPANACPWRARRDGHAAQGPGSRPDGRSVVVFGSLRSRS